MCNVSKLGREGGRLQLPMSNRLEQGRWQAAMNRENSLLVTDGPVEVRRLQENYQSFYGISLKSIKNKGKMSTCNRLDLEVILLFSKLDCESFYHFFAK